MDAKSLECVLNESRSQWHEDISLLPALLAATGHRPGTFVELGALDGLTYSNTVALERCYGWSGLLIEANPSNFAMLQQARRSSARIAFSAICDDDSGAGTVNISSLGGGASGDPSQMQDRKYQRIHSTAPLVKVPCRPLPSLMRLHGLGRHADLLSLDVEGAEPAVLRTLVAAGQRHAIFKYVMVEASSPSAVAQTHRLLTQLGMRPLPSNPLHGSRVYTSVLSPPSGQTARRSAHSRAASRSRPSAPAMAALAASGGYPAGGGATAGSGGGASSSSRRGGGSAGDGAALRPSRQAEMATNCVLRHANAAERTLLPALVRATGGVPGTFVEIGGLPEHSLTNTLERCYNWSGLMVVRDAAAASLLAASGRRATVVRGDAGGVCAEHWGGSRILVTNLTRPAVADAVARYPCRSMRSMAEQAGLSRVHFLALNMRNAERAFEAPTRYGSRFRWPLANASHVPFLDQAPVLAVRWMPSGAWDRCAACRIAHQFGELNHDRRFDLRHGPKGSWTYRVYLARRLCWPPEKMWGVLGAHNSIKVCFSNQWRHSPMAKCGESSEAACAWSEMAWSARASWQ